MSPYGIIHLHPDKGAPRLRVPLRLRDGPNVVRKSFMKKRFIILFIVLASMLLGGCCLSHDWRDATCVEPKTCAKCGKTEGEALGHTWIPATCTEPKTCSVCGETEGIPLGHDTSPATVEQPETCKRCGETFGSPLAAYDPVLDYFMIPAGLGPAEYSKEEICQMIDDGLTLDEVAERIQTYPDLVQYLLNKNYTADDLGDMHFYYHGLEYSVNRSAQTVFTNNKGNCGGCSNLVNYILRGDYDSQGYVQEAHLCGGHVYNYFVKDGRYYFCDLTSITQDCPLNNYCDVDDPAEYSQKYVTSNHHRKALQDSFLLMQYMYEWEGNHLPVAWSNDVETAKGYPFLNGIAEDVSDTVQILYLEEGYPGLVFVDSPPIDVWPKEAQ